MKKLISTVLVALVIPVTGLAAPGGFGGFRDALVPVEDASCEDVLDFVNITVEIDMETDRLECALLLADLKMALNELILADLSYESCMAEVERDGGEESDCNAAASRLDDAALAYRRATSDYVGAGCMSD